MSVIEVIENAIEILPTTINECIGGLQNKEHITEIRLRVGKNVRVYFGKIEQKLPAVVGKSDLIKILSNISSNSIYSVQNDINKGFVTTEGGNRIGVAGEAVVQDGKIKNIKNISSMNIRIAKEFVGISDDIISKIVEGSSIKNTIIISPPGLGKTTLLRDIIRNLSNLGYNVSVIDERGEIAAMHEGRPSLNLGERTDVISYIDKVTGMQMAIRSMAPDVICTDEIGDKKDMDAISYVCKSGVKFITTMHGSDIKDVRCSSIGRIMDENYLDMAILLSKKNGIGSIEKIYDNLNVKEKVIC